MKTLLTGLLLASLSLAASAADDKRSSGSADTSASSRAESTEKQSGASDTVDKRKHPEAKGRTTMDKARPASGHSGSAAGETGGPAATDGHTGSTTNKSNSPGK